MRWLAELSGASRTPVWSLAVGLCAARKGLSPAPMHDDPKQSFALQLEVQEAFGFDSPPFYFYASYGTFEHAAGLGYPSSELRVTPTLPYYPVREPADVSRLELPDVARAGMLPQAMRFSELQRQHGLPVSLVLGSVFTIAANICGIENLFCWMIEKPRLVHRLMERAGAHLLEVARHWVECFGAERMLPVLWEAMAIHGLISPRQLADFILPHQRALHEGILGLGVPGLVCHLCGEQAPLLPLWAEIPMGSPGVVSVGAEVELADVGRHFRDSIVMGNLDPVLLMRGDPEQVRAQTRRCLEQGAGHPSGFILAPGCALQEDLPAANLEAMVRAARG